MRLAQAHRGVLWSTAGIHPHNARTGDARAIDELRREHRAAIPRGVVHCFTGGAAQLEAYLELGLHIGITGWICDDRRGRGLRDLVRRIPPERLMIETDSPFLRSRDLPGADRRNEPANLAHILKRVAGWAGTTSQVLARTTTTTAETFFGRGKSFSHLGRSHPTRRCGVMKRLAWIVATCVVLAAGSARADKLPRKLVISFDRCSDSFLEAGYMQSREFSVDYECKQAKSGYACAPSTGGSALSDLSPRKLTLTAKASATGIELADARGASIRVSLKDGAGKASFAETISTQDKHGSRFCSGDAAISARKLADARQQPAGFPTTGIAECDQLIRTYVSCNALPESAREAFIQNADAWKKALEAGGDAARTQLVESCRQATEAAQESLKAIGC